MIKISVLYPNEEGKTFDMDYYCNVHIPMARERLGTVCKKVEVDQGLFGVEPGARAAYVAMGHLYFDSLATFQATFGIHAAALMADVPNYTNIEPTIQISEVKI